MKTKVVAVISGTKPVKGDPTTCGEDTTLHRRQFPNAGLARKWVDERLAEPMPEGILFCWGFMSREEWSDTYLCWGVVEESDTITAEERNRKTQWFTK